MSFFLFTAVYGVLFASVAAGMFNGFTLTAIVLLSVGLCVALKKEGRKL